jgi:RecB family exonuclease
MVHLVLEEKLSKEREIDLEELTKAFGESRSRFDPENKINDELICVGQQIIEEFYDRHSGETFRIEHKEKEFNFVIGIFNINGYIDRIDEYNDRIEVIDYKTR